MYFIVFDFDGTLVDSQHGIVEAMTAAFEAMALAPPDANAVRRVVGLRLESAMAELAPEQSSAAHHDLSEAYRSHAMSLRTDPDYHEPLFPGAREALKALKHPEVFLGIATGKNRRGLLWSLDYHDIAEHFMILKSADDGPSKPHPDILEQAMAEAGVGPENTVMIGDTAFDILLARNAGARALGVGWGYHPDEDLMSAGAHKILSNFDELIPALAQMGMLPR